MIQTRPSFRFLEIYVGFYIAASTLSSALALILLNHQAISPLAPCVHDVRLME
jgi:hypothetical protein